MTKKYFYLLYALFVFMRISGGVEATLSPTLKIENAWIRASSGPNAALFMTLVNPSHKKESLTGAQLEACAYAELHTHKEKAGVFRMRPVDRIEIPPQGRQELRPGGLHVMLMNLHKPLKEGDQVAVILFFGEKNSLHLTVPVKEMGNETPPCMCPE